MSLETDIQNLTLAIRDLITALASSKPEPKTKKTHDKETPAAPVSAPVATDGPDGIPNYVSAAHTPVPVSAPVTTDNSPTVRGGPASLHWHSAFATVATDNPPTVSGGATSPVANPPTKPSDPTPAPAAVTPNVPAPVPVTIKLAQIQAAAQKLVLAGKQTFLVAELGKLGAKRISEVKADDYAKLFEAINKELA